MVWPGHPLDVEIAWLKNALYLLMELYWPESPGYPEPLNVNVEANSARWTIVTPQVALACDGHWAVDHRPQIHRVNPRIVRAAWSKNAWPGWISEQAREFAQYPVPEIMSAQLP
jgi:hypothetical protein